jgi:hypothetical protein
MSKLPEVAHEAVMFLSSQQVSNQMRYAEFEALLDGVVTMADSADQEVSAVYLQLDGQLQPKAIVFFLLYFDEEGRADTEWNLPLQRLAKISGRALIWGRDPSGLPCAASVPFPGIRRICGIP